MHSLYDRPMMTPFASEFNVRIMNYNRATSMVATAGKISVEGMNELKYVGFKLIVDLRMPSEGIDIEIEAARINNIRYVNMPILGPVMKPHHVEKFAKLVEENDGLTMLHCASSNRAGGLWALYRISIGVPVKFAIEEGRAAGMMPNIENNFISMGMIPADE